MQVKKEEPEERIGNDIKLLEENLKKIRVNDEKERGIVELAKRYYADAQHYLKKKDYLTAFGCITYAHGLIDALIEVHRKR